MVFNVEYEVLYTKLYDMKYIIIYNYYIQLL